MTVSTEAKIVVDENCKYPIAVSASRQNEQPLAETAIDGYRGVINFQATSHCPNVRMECPSLIKWSVQGASESSPETTVTTNFEVKRKPDEDKTEIRREAEIALENFIRNSSHANTVIEQYTFYDDGKKIIEPGQNGNGPYRCSKCGTCFNVVKVEVKDRLA